jgi:hypothetical protein
MDDITKRVVIIISVAIPLSIFSWFVCQAIFSDPCLSFLMSIGTIGFVFAVYGLMASRLYFGTKDMFQQVKHNEYRRYLERQRYDRLLPPGRY